MFAHGHTSQPCPACVDGVPTPPGGGGQAGVRGSAGIDRGFVGRLVELICGLLVWQLTVLLVVRLPMPRVAPPFEFSRSECGGSNFSRAFGSPDMITGMTPLAGKPFPALFRSPAE